MSLLLRSRLIVIGAIAAALWLAWELATDSYTWPAIIAATALGAGLIVACRVPIHAIALGILLFGYMVGNRGFAQLMPSPRVPLLPAEMGLLVAGGWLLIQCARERTLPFRRNLLNAAVLLWIVAGSVRVFFDVRPFGFVALRDYAMIYYAAFFFIAQEVGTGDARRFLLRVLLAAGIVQPIVAVLVEVFPEFFLYTLSVRGVPLIYFKGDLALTFTAVSALLLFFLVSGQHRLWAWPLASIELLYVIGGANRASMLGALVALAWLAFSRARRFVWVQAVSVGFAVLTIAGLALLTENSWAQRKLHGLIERAASITDFTGRGVYLTEESGMKGDNNRFRAVWWRTVIDDTLAQNPAFGLGFGYDLARNFVQEYNPEMGDDFTARSPHSIVVSTFGRMGFVGLGVLGMVIVVLIVRTWRVLRQPSSEWATLGLWAALWVIFVSACFGVVLEGPMGAVVFWTLLGIACASGPPETSENTDEIATNAQPALQPAETRDEVTAAHFRTT